jgi:hypothetical protein
MPPIRKLQLTTVGASIVEHTLSQKLPAEVVIRTDPGNTGTIQFEVSSQTVTDFSGQHAYPADKEIYLTMGRGDKLYTLASGANQSFITEY